MTELQRFRPSLAHRQHVPFDFERASIHLLSSRQPRRRIKTALTQPLPLHSEWRDASHLSWKAV